MKLLLLLCHLRNLQTANLLVSGHREIELYCSIKQLCDATAAVL